MLRDYFTHISSWNPKANHLYMVGYQLDDEPNLYIENCWCTKHPFTYGCLGFQVGRSISAVTPLETNSQLEPENWYVGRWWELSFWKGRPKFSGFLQIVLELVEMMESFWGVIQPIAVFMYHYVGATHTRFASPWDSWAHFGKRTKWMRYIWMVNQALRRLQKIQILECRLGNVQDDGKLLVWMTTGIVFLMML